MVDDTAAAAKAASVWRRVASRKSSAASHRAARFSIRTLFIILPIYRHCIERRYSGIGCGLVGFALGFRC